MTPGMRAAYIAEGAAKYQSFLLKQAAEDAAYWASPEGQAEKAKGGLRGKLANPRSYLVKGTKGKDKPAATLRAAVVALRRACAADPHVTAMPYIVRGDGSRLSMQEDNEVDRLMDALPNPSLQTVGAITKLAKPTDGCRAMVGMGVLARRCQHKGGYKVTGMSGAYCAHHVDSASQLAVEKVRQHERRRERSAVLRSKRGQR